MIMIRSSLLLVLCFWAQLVAANPPGERPPNILFAISDDQSFAHTSYAGCDFVATPAFDRIAREGVYFENCMAGSPGCAPSRSTIVTGRYHWQNEQSGQHASSWLKKYVPFVDVLTTGGYVTGRTGKGVDPFQYARDERDALWRTTNAAGLSHSDIRYTEQEREEMEGYTSQISSLNYFENFKYFMENVRGEEPFFFWYGASEPHRDYEEGSWKRMGKRLEDVTVPGFLPDTEEVRGDLLDYAVEIEWFDRNLDKMLNYLDDIGELENTVVIVTSDNGKPFPRAKANSYEYGIHVPMAIRYPQRLGGGRVVKDPTSFVDIAPTILDIAQLPPSGMMPISGRSFLDLLTEEGSGNPNESRSYALSGRERHSSSRYENRGYPQRAIRNRDHLLIWNMRPDRWPAGAPQLYDSKDTTVLLPPNGVGTDGTYYSMSAFTDVDESPSKQYLLEHASDSGVQDYYSLSFAKRPEYELFNVEEDPSCLHNLVDDPQSADVMNELKSELVRVLRTTEDPRVVGSDTGIFDTYLRYSPIRKFPEPSAPRED